MQAQRSGCSGWLGTVRCNHLCCPVSPVCPSLKMGQCSDERCNKGHDAFEGTGADDIAVGDYVIGKLPDERAPRQMTSPKEMTPQEWALHMVHHLPCCKGCPHCVAGKLNNLPHRRSTTERSLPHLVADYAYLRDSISDTTLTTLVVCRLPFRVYFATVVDAN